MAVRLFTSGLHLEPIIYNIGANPETAKESSNLRYSPGKQFWIWNMLREVLGRRTKDHWKKFYVVSLETQINLMYLNYPFRPQGLYYYVILLFSLSYFFFPPCFELPEIPTRYIKFILVLVHMLGLIQIFIIWSQQGFFIRDYTNWRSVRRGKLYRHFYFERIQKSC